MILRSPRLDQGHDCWAIALLGRNGLRLNTFRTYTPLRDAMQSPGILSDNQDVTKLELLFKHGFLWELQLSLFHVFTAQLALFFQFYRYFLIHVNYIFFDVSYALPSVKLKHSYYALFVDNFFRWGLSVYYAFHDQPEEDSGHFVYHCLNRDNAKGGLVIYRKVSIFTLRTLCLDFQFRPILLDTTIIKHWSNPS